MPKITTVFKSNGGVTCETLEKATIQDLYDVLGNTAFAAAVFEKRHAIAEILAEHAVVVETNRNLSDI